mmetsp:Transcript_41440/g.104502  ORF Transcript_41440/g.104502 Transcript_41440/m.104502 type:complete len:560 (-) Transcript_41440:285-1964(-)
MASNKEVRRWTVKDVGTWLESLGLHDFKSGFADNAVSGTELLDLDEEDLVFLGLTKIGYRKKVSLAIEELRKASAKETKEEDDSGSDSASLSASAASSTKSTSSTITLKLSLNDKTSRLTVPTAISFPRLKKKIEAEVGSMNLGMKWKDSDGDLAELNSQKSWEEAVGECGKKGTMIIKLRKSRLHGPGTVQVAECISSSECMVIIDTRGKICSISNAACELFGWSRTQAEGSNIKVLMPDHYAREHDRYLKRYLKTLEPRVIGSSRQVTGMHRDGRTMDLELSLAEGKSKNRHWFIGRFRKLRDDEASEGVLPEMKAQFAITDNLLDCCIIGNEKGTVLFFNTAAEKLFGYGRAEVVGKNVKMLMPEEIASVHDTYVDRFVRTGEKKVIGIKDREVTAKRKDGSTFPASLHLTDQRWGKMAIITAVLKLAGDGQSSVKELVTKKKAFLENLPIAGVVIDDKGVVQVYNNAAYDLFGFEPATVLGKNVTMLIYDKDTRDKHDEFIARYCRTGHSKNVVGVGRKVTAVHKTGVTIEVHLSVQAEKVGAAHVFTGLVQCVE